MVACAAVFAGAADFVVTGVAFLAGGISNLLRPWRRPVIIVVLIATEMRRAVSLLRHRAVRHQCACHSVQNWRERALHFIGHSITDHQLQEQMPHIFQRADREAVAILMPATS